MTPSRFGKPERPEPGDRLNLPVWPTVIALALAALVVAVWYGNVFERPCTSPVVGPTALPWVEQMRGTGPAECRP